MKKYAILVAICSLFLIACNSKTPEENIKNVELISIGQSYDEVIDIMGSPEKKYDISNSAYCISYPVPIDRADAIKLIFNKSDDKLLFTSYIGGESREIMQEAPTR